MSKYCLIADYFSSDILGGGELSNEELTRMLIKEGFDVSQKRTTEVTKEWLDENKDNNFIIGNFLGLSEDIRKYLKLFNYVIIEHDHKYLTTRDPSKFDSFKAPESAIINKDFYRNALAVFCQSKLHTDIVKKNLRLDNIINLGGNLWSDETLDLLEKLNNNDKIYDNCIIKSKNPIKGQEQAREYCNKNDIYYDLIEEQDNHKFLNKLSFYKKLFFFPQTTETFSRVCVEARMLNVSVVLKGNVGAFSEDYIKNNKGLELIKIIRGKKVDILNKIKNAFLNKKETLDVTVILNLYRRPKNLQLQIDSILNQSLRPKEIWVWRNYHDDTNGFSLTSISGVDKWFESNHNWKFYGRFAAAQLAQTEYIAIFDDDTIPGKDWFKNCMETMKETPGILGGIGIILNDGKHYANSERVGWATNNQTTVEVDLVGHAWFFRKEYLKYLWIEEPVTWDNGEDIHFSYLAQKYGGIKTYVPKHPIKLKDLSSSLLGYELGVDHVATSRPQNHGVFYSERDKCVQNAVEGGWKTVKMRGE